MSEETIKVPAESKISICRSQSFIKLYSTNLLVTPTDSDIRIELFNEKFQMESGWAFQSDGMVILTREAAKKLFIMLEDKIKSYEKEHGEIKISDDRMKFQYLLR